MIWSHNDHEFHMEGEIELRDETHQYEVTRIHEVLEPLDDEGFFWPTSYTYEFKIFAFSDLTGDPEVPVEDLTEQENFDVQKYLDECAADQAAAAAEARADR